MVLCREKRAMILELATHWLAETSEGIQESVLFGWEAGTEFATGC